MASLEFGFKPVEIAYLGDHNLSREQKAAHDEEKERGRRRVRILRLQHILNYLDVKIKGNVLNVKAKWEVAVRS